MNKSIYSMQGHNLVVGSTGSGKSFSVLFPYILDIIEHEEEFLVTDLSGELYDATSALLKEKGYNVECIDFGMPNLSVSWNPLSKPYNYYLDNNMEECIKSLSDLAYCIFHDKKTPADPFWELSSKDFFIALCWMLFEISDNEEQINMFSIKQMAYLGFDRYGGSTYISELFSIMAQDDNPLYMKAYSVIKSPEDTRKSIMSVFFQKIDPFFTSPSLIGLISENPIIEKDELNDKKTAIFLNNRNSRETYYPLINIFIKQTIQNRKSIASRNNIFHFIIEDMQSMSIIPTLNIEINYARKFDFRFTLVLNSLYFFMDGYGKNEANHILANCNNFILTNSKENEVYKFFINLVMQIHYSKHKFNLKLKNVTKSKYKYLCINGFNVDILESKNFELNKPEKKERLYDRKFGVVPTIDIKEIVKEHKRESMLKAFKEEEIAESDHYDSGEREFNVDDLISRIDRKIALLEDEEGSAEE